MAVEWDLKELARSDERKERAHMSMLQDLVERHYENVSMGNIEADREIFSADVVTVEPLVGTMEGIEPFLAYSAGFHSAFPDGRLALRSAVESGNWIAVEGIFSGNNTGPLATPAGEMAPTNRRVEFPFADFFKVENGRVTSHHVYYDQIGFLGQLGLMAQPQAVGA
jgi:predicted ester cyclase